MASRQRRGMTPAGSSRLGRMRRWMVAGRDSFYLEDTEMPQVRFETAAELDANTEKVTVEAWRCKTCGKAWIGSLAERMATFCCTYQRQCDYDGGCDRASEPHYVLCKDHQAIADAALREAARAKLRRATREEAAAWKLFVVEGDDDMAESTLEEAIERLDGEGGVIYQGVLHQVRLDADDIVERACDDHHESVGDKAVVTDDLRAAIDRWNELHKDIGSVDHVPGVAYFVDKRALPS